VQLQEELIVKSKILAFCAIIVLTLQPIILTSEMIMNEQECRRNQPDVKVAQDIGPRLEPEELTPHVPVFIEGTEDFELQGWPGEGTEEEPYLISGLNITRDLDTVLISIKNTFAHFLIQDCYVRQISNAPAVVIENTTHATLEYNSIFSPTLAINLFLANYTHVSHSMLRGGTNYALTAESCPGISLQNCMINATDYRTTYIEYCHGALIDSCSFYPGGINHNFILASSNGTAFTNNDVHGGAEALQATYCHGLVIQNIYLDGPQGGPYVAFSPGVVIENLYGSTPNVRHMYILLSHGASITSCDISDGPKGYQITQCNDTVISGCRISDVVLEGMDIEGCHNLSILNTIVEESGSVGIDIDECDELEIHNCSFISSGDTAVDADDCQNPTLTGNYIQDAAEYGMYAVGCNNGTGSDNHIEIVGTTGIYLESCDNWVVSGNTISEMAGRGIQLLGCDSAEIQYNTVTSTVLRGLDLSNSPDSVIIGNILSDAVSQALYLSDCDRAYLADNSISDSVDGIYITGSDNLTVIENTITTIENEGAAFYGAVTATFSDNTVSQALNGLYISQCINGTFERNEFDGCGLIAPISLNVQHYNHTVNDNIVNGKILLYLTGQSDMVIDGTQCGEIITVDCENMTIQGGEFETSSAGILTAFSERISIEAIEISGNRYGIVFHETENATVINSRLTGTVAAKGIYGYNSDGLRVVESSFDWFNPTGTAVDLFQCDRFHLENLTIENSFQGVYCSYGDEGVVMGSHFRHIPGQVIYGLYDSNWHQIVNNTIYNCTIGIAAYDSMGYNVTGNVFRHCTSYGFEPIGSTSDGHNVTLNHFESCRQAIRVQNGDNLLIINNTILWSSQYGIVLLSSSGTDVYYNTIAFSGTANAFDDSLNTFDDGVELGNCWDDWDGTGSYDIVPGSSADNYPCLYAPTTPMIDQPLDISYAEGSTGNTLRWRPRDDFLKSWTLEIDGELWEEGAWKFEDGVTVNVDGLAYGTHTATFTVWDTEENSVSDQVFIRVFDDTPPIMSSEADTTVFEDGTDQTVTWEVSDLNPDAYEVRVDGEEDSTGTWTSGTLSLDLDGLSEGIYEYQVIIYDLDGNSDSDTILVEVIDDDTAPTIDSPDDLAYIYGSTGNTIIWTAADDYPASYEIVKNGSTVASGSWAGARITFNADELSVGTHEFVITVFDHSGQTATDTVAITVRAQVPVTPAPLAPDLILLVMVGAIAVVLVLGIAWYLRKGRGA
jgi:parallel beta-helix repeat protein